MSTSWSLHDQIPWLWPFLVVSLVLIVVLGGMWDMVGNMYRMFTGFGSSQIIEEQLAKHPNTPSKECQTAIQIIHQTIYDCDHEAIGGQGQALPTIVNAG